MEQEEIQELTGPTLSGEAALYVGTFVILCTLGAAILVIYEVANATGSPADTAHSIITNLWHGGAAALVLTLAAAGISRPPVCRRPPAPAAFQLRVAQFPQLVPFPLEYALYRIFVSPVSHSRASRNPELEAAFQYQQIYLETVLAWAYAEPQAGPQGPQQSRKPSPGSNPWEHPHQPPSFRRPVRFGRRNPQPSPGAEASLHKVRPRLQTTKRCCASRPGRAGLRTVDAPTGPYVDLCVNHSPLAPNVGARGAADLKSQF